MKKTLLIIGLSICVAFQAQSQNMAVKKAEEYFISLIGRKLFSRLNNDSLTKEPFKKLFYYSYQIFNDDSTIWYSYNSAQPKVDSFTKTAFKEAVDSMKAKGTISLLINEEKTYIPLYLFYKTRDINPYDDTISIGSMESIFLWGFNDKMEPESVFRITKPFIYKVPTPKPYYEIRKKKK